MGRQSCPVMTQIMFNMKSPLYSDVRFRQAVAYALDGDAINGNIYGMSAVSGAGTAGPDVPGYDEKLRDQYFKYDPEKAKALMQELGYELKDGVYQKDGKPLEVPFEIYNWASIPRFGEAIASQLTAFGIKTTLETVEMGKYMEDWSAGVDKMMIMSGWCGEGGTYNLWGSSGFARPMGYDDQEIFKSLDDSNVTVDSAKHDELIRQAANKIYGQYWAVPLGFYQPFVASRSYVKEHTTAMWFDNLVTEKNNVWLDK
jgi:peptide/nickel transport system substrate-binding protein